MGLVGRCPDLAGALLGWGMRHAAARIPLVEGTLAGVRHEVACGKLATREGLVGTWLGSTVGMVAADALAIGVGQLLGKRLPGKVIRWDAAASFVLLGTILVLEGVGLLG